MSVRNINGQVAVTTGSDAASSAGSAAVSTRKSGPAMNSGNGLFEAHGFSVGGDPSLAGGSLLKRTGDAFKSIVSTVLGTVTSPTETIRVQADELRGKKPALNDLVAETQGQLTVLRSELTTAQTQQQTFRTDAKTMKDAGNIDDAKALLAKAIALQPKIDSLSAQVDAAEKAADQAGETREAIGTQIDKRLDEADAAIAGSRTAELKDKVAKTIQGFDTDTSSSDLDRAIGTVELKNATADARLKDAQEHSGAALEHRVAQAKVTAAVDDEFAKL